MNERYKAPNSPGQATTVDQSIESAWHLLYRFFWPFQYFQDVNRGNRQQQLLSYQYNRSIRFCLPGFILKWSVLSMLWFAWGSFLDSRLSFTPLVATCFVASCLSLIVVALLSVSWFWLDQFPERF